MMIHSNKHNLCFSVEDKSLDRSDFLGVGFNHFHRQHMSRKASSVFRNLHLGGLTLSLFLQSNFGFSCSSFICCSLVEIKITMSSKYINKLLLIWSRKNFYDCHKGTGGV